MASEYVYVIKTLLWTGHSLIWCSAYFFNSTSNTPKKQTNTDRTDSHTHKQTKSRCLGPAPITQAYGSTDSNVCVVVMFSLLTCITGIYVYLCLILGLPRSLYQREEIQKVIFVKKKKKKAKQQADGTKIGSTHWFVWREKCQLPCHFVERVSEFPVCVRCVRKWMNACLSYMCMSFMVSLNSQKPDYLDRNSYRIETCHTSVQ